MCECVTGFYCSNDKCDHCRPVSRCPVGKGVKHPGRPPFKINAQELQSHLSIKKLQLETENLFVSVSQRIKPLTRSVLHVKAGPTATSPISTRHVEPIPGQTTPPLITIHIEVGRNIRNMKQ